MWGDFMDCVSCRVRFRCPSKAEPNSLACILTLTTYGQREEPVPDTRNAEVLPSLRETVAGYRHRTILQQCPVRKQIHSDGGTQQTMGERRLIDANAAIKNADKRYSEWNLAMAAAEGNRQISMVYKKQELFKAVRKVIESCPPIDPESLRPVSEWELNPDKWTCEWFRCKKCHHTSCCTDAFCGGCGAKMKNAGVKPEDMPIPTETIQKTTQVLSGLHCEEEKICFHKEE